MNYTQNQEPRLDFRIQWLRTFETWLVGPAPLVVTCDEFLGDPEEAIAEESARAHSDHFAHPEASPEEFEQVFQWFQS